MLARGAEPKKTARVEEDIACSPGLFHSSNLTKVFAVAAVDRASDPRFISDERDRLRTCVGTLGIGRLSSAAQPLQLGLSGPPAVGLPVPSYRVCLIHAVRWWERCVGICLRCWILRVSCTSDSKRSNSCD